MQAKRKTMIVVGSAQGISAGVTSAFIERGYQRRRQPAQHHSIHLRREREGKHDSSFELTEPEVGLRDVLRAEILALDAVPALVGRAG